MSVRFPQAAFADSFVDPACKTCVADPQAPVFTSAAGRPLTRFDIYKRVRQHAARLESAATSPTRRITPHVFYTAAVHLLEAGVEVNVTTDHAPPETGVARRCRAADVAGVVVTTGTAPRQWLVAGGVSLDAARAPP